MNAAPTPPLLFAAARQASATGLSSPAVIFFSLIGALMLTAPTEPPANAIVLATNTMASAALSFRTERAYGRGRDATKAPPVTSGQCRRYVCQNYICMSPE